MAGKISKAEVEYLAKLARIGLTEKEITKYQKDLGDILGYVEKLNEVNTDNVEPMAAGIQKRNELRDDEIAKIEGAPAELVSEAPKHEDGFIKVKSVLE